MRVNVGMIGLTHPHSAWHLRALDALDTVDEIVLFDPDRGAAERTLEGCRKARTTAPTLGDVLARPDVPVVFVVLPNDVTPSVVVQAAEAGKHLVQLRLKRPGARWSEHGAAALLALRARAASTLPAAA